MAELEKDTQKSEADIERHERQIWWTRTAAIAASIAALSALFGWIWDDLHQGRILKLALGSLIDMSATLRRCRKTGAVHGAEGAEHDGREPDDSGIGDLDGLLEQVGTQDWQQGQWHEGKFLAPPARHPACQPTPGRD